MTDFERVEALYKAISDIDAIKNYDPTEYETNNKTRYSKVDQVINFLRLIDTSEFDHEYQDQLCDIVKKALIVVYGTKFGLMNKKIGLESPSFAELADGDESVNEKIKANLERAELEGDSGNIFENLASIRLDVARRPSYTPPDDYSYQEEEIIIPQDVTFDLESERKPRFGGFGRKSNKKHQL